jgi:hypothetical protein
MLKTLVRFIPFYIDEQDVHILPGFIAEFGDDILGVL